ncbi:hypothetical protein QMK33_03230 [Hymenobacter sp. H14-R3]|nr:hypothetical protein [Hymenobacter sp. H14-R3]
MLQPDRIVEEALKQQLWQAGSLVGAVQVLHQFKASGGKQQDALRILAHLRRLVVSEQEEDKILELMDLATGFCQAHRRIW